jgi:tetratricopeptide (TPR) repeat protein
LRESAGLSQTALAGEDLHPSYISLLESGRRAPTADVVAVLSGRLGVSPDALSGEISLEIEEPLALAEASQGLGRSAEAIALLEPFRAEMSVRRCTRDALIFRAAFVLASALESVGRVDEATALLEVLRTASDSSRARHPWLPTAVSLVRCYRESGDAGRAIDVGEDALRRFDGLTTSWVDGHAQLVSTLARAYCERGDLLRAGLLLEGLLDASSADTVSDQADTFWNAAIIAAQRGRSLDAMRLCEQAATLVAQGHDDRARARLQITRAWVHLAQDPPQAAEARDLVTQALPALRQYAGPVAASMAQTELARSELLLGRPDIARQHADEAVAQLTDDQPIERARALTVLGAALVALDEPALATASLEDADRLLTAAVSSRHSAAAWRSLGDLYRSIGAVDRAQAAFDAAFTAAGVCAEPLALPAVLPTQRRSASRTTHAPS